MDIDEAKEHLSGELFEAYFGDNEVVAYEVEMTLLDDEQFFKDMRENFTFGGLALRAIYQKHIARACEEISKKYCGSQAKIDEAFRVFQL